MIFVVAFIFTGFLFLRYRDVVSAALYLGAVILIFVALFFTSTAKADQLLDQIGHPILSWDAGKYVYVISDARCFLPNGGLRPPFQVYRFTRPHYGLLNLDGVGCMAYSDARLLPVYWKKGPKQMLPITKFKLISSPSGK